MIPPGYLPPVGVPDDATPFEYPIPGTNAGDPQAFIDREVSQAQTAIDQINAAHLQRQEAAFSTWLQLAINNIQTGHPEKTPPKPVQYSTVSLDSQLEDRSATGDTNILWVWQVYDGPLGDPCPNPPAPVPPGHPSIGKACLDVNMQPYCYTALHDDTVAWGSIVTVIATGTPVGLQQLTSADVPVGQYLKSPFPFNDANPPGRYFKQS